MMARTVRALRRERFALAVFLAALGVALAS
jgi:hypothetical protein